MTISYEIVKSKMLKDTEVLKEYNILAVEYEIAEILIKARTKARLTQKEVAIRMETSQAQIARLESGQHMPSIQSIAKYARAIGNDISITIHP